MSFPPHHNFNNVDLMTGGLKKASAHARQGIWYDALDMLIAEQSPTDNWKNI